MSAPGGAVWAHFRAALLLFVVGQAAVDAVPLPRLRPADLRAPALRAELRAQSAALRPLWDLAPPGLVPTQPPPTPQDLGAALLRLSNTCNIVRDAVLAPTAPLRRGLGLGQSWGLFALPSTEVGRLVVRGARADGAWVDLYRAGVGGAPALSRPLAGRRLRGVWDDAGDRPAPWPSWGRLAAWIAERAWAEDPALITVEVRIDAVRLPLPGGPAAPADAPVHRLRFARPVAP